jgi:hypothetical protein
VWCTITGTWRPVEGVRECVKFSSPFSPVPFNLHQHRNPMGAIGVPKVAPEIHLINTHIKNTSIR